MAKAINELLESDLLDEQTKATISEAFEAKIAEAREEIATELREEFATRYDNDKSNLVEAMDNICLLYTSPSPRDLSTSRMPSSA